MNDLNGKKRIRKLWKRIAAAMGCVVVFVTTYALILPAITLDGDTAAEEPGVVLSEPYAEPAYSEPEPASDPESEPEPDPEPESDPEPAAEPAPEIEAPQSEPEAAEVEAAAEDEIAEPAAAAPDDAMSAEAVEAEVIEQEDADEPEAAPDEPTQGDPTADVESEAYWNAMFADLELTGRWNDDLLAVAETQLGYAESTANFIVNESGVRKGYTRYGAWYGIPYGDWSAMFVSFCLRYADIPASAMPRGADCQGWAEHLKDMDLFAYAEDYIPVPGDLVFFAASGGSCERVGIVAAADADGGSLTVLEGDCGDCVQYELCELSGSGILGYGQLPEKPTDRPAVTLTGNAGDVLVVVDAPDGAFPDGVGMTVTPVDSEAVLEAITDTVEGRITSIQAVDITFCDKDGTELQPEVPIRVTMSSAAAGEAEAVQVVHVDDELQAQVVEDASAVEDNAVAFDADSFSVYALVGTDTIDDPQGLDGQSFGLISATDGTKPSGTAMQSSAKNNGTQLQGMTLTVKVDPVGRTSNVYVANNSNITMWTFHAIGDNQYHITTAVSGSLKYLKISADGVSLVDESAADDDCRITVTPGTGGNAGKMKLSSGSGALKLDSGSFVRTNASSNSGVWMNLAELSNLNDDDFVVYTAEKVSVSGSVGEDGTVEYDVKNGDQVILYTRIWNEDTLRYDYYAIDYDGMLVKAYESGDTISWVGSKVNTMLWDFTEYYYEGTNTPNYYYELQNAYSGKYIAPQVSGTGFLSDSTIGLNLNGRRYNEYYTTILAWDDPYYDYASLKVQDHQLISAPMARADDFYFAIMTTSQASTTPTPVATLDHTAYGITLKMQDYENINSSNRSQTQVDVLGNTQYNQWTGSPGLLEKNLNGDYPDVKNSTHSLSELYSEAITVNQQFLLSTYQETGYFEYDSTQNFAHLITSTNDYWYGQDRPGGGTYTVGDFVVYNELGTSSESGKDTLKHGQFLPYNDLMVLKNGEWVPRDYSNIYTNEMDISANPLSSLDPRKGEKLYNIPCQKGKTGPNYVDHFFGMELEASFMQSESGLDAWGHDLIFEFSGDDDFWLYVDGMLVLDLGGIHSALSASINFRTGDVVVNGRPTNLRTCYKEAYLEKHPDASDDEVNEWLNGIFKDDGSNTGTVFKDYSGHTMRMFYMERGAGASNLHMRFNLAPYVGGEVQLEKEVTGADTVDTLFPFQIWYEAQMPTGPEYVLWGRTEEEQNKVTDTMTGEPASYAETYSVDGLTYNNVFFLRAGQTVSIRLPSEETKYYITECALDTGTFDQVKANDEVLDGTPTSAADRCDYTIGDSTVAGRKKVVYENHVSEDALKTLTITKRLWQDDEKTREIFSGSAADADNTEFRFRVYIGKNSGGEYEVYNTGKYYIKDPNGCYCIYQNGGFVSTGKSVFSELSTVVPEGEWKSEQEKATFYSSPGGAIDRIKAGYSIEIPGLMAGTSFKVEEWDNEVPAGYYLLGYTLTEGAYSETNEGDGVGEGTIRSDRENETVSVHNRHGYGLTVNKIWSDAAFMASHDDIYFAVYLKGETEPIPGSVRQMKHPDTSMNWFFPELAEEKTLNDYEVYEVELTGSDITVDEATGAVTGYDSITRKEQNGTIDVGGVTNEHGYSVNYSYTVGYSREYLTAQQIADRVNSRTDTVSNSRAGIKLVKTGMNGEPLQGAVFVFRDSQGHVKTFTSAEDGLIVVAYLQADTDYTLQETAAPYGYQSLIDQLTIRVDAAGTVYVNGSPNDPENGFYTIKQVADPTPDNMPTVTVRNKPVALQAVKVDSYTQYPMPGVKFALYKEVYETSAVSGLPDPNYPMPDYTPMSGYEELITDENGVIPKIVLRNADNPNGLTAGVYYLREEETPSGYNSLGVDIRMTISATGQITLESARRPTQSGHWQIGTLSTDIAEMTYDGGVLRITVKNTPKDPVRIRKLETGTDDKYLQGISFELYKIGQLEDGRPKPGEIPVLSGTTDAEGILNLGGLEENLSYYLFETETLDGYMTLPAPVVITTVGPNTINASMNGSPLECEKTTDANGKSVWEIKVYNSTGIELPNTGGTGTIPYTLAGGALLGISAAALTARRKRRRREGGGPGP